MGWETRRRGGSYYTRSRRVNGCVVREYVGAGEVGETAAAMDAEDRAARLAEREAVRRQRDDAAAVLDALKALQDVCMFATSERLAADGLHEHRGQWRRRRQDDRRVSGQEPW